MPVDRRLLEILRCPVTKQQVLPLSRDKLDKLNALIEKGDVHYLDGSNVAQALDEGLITENGRTIYRVDDSIPVMLEDQSIPTEQLSDF